MSTTGVPSFSYWCAIPKHVWGLFNLPNVLPALTNAPAGSASALHFYEQTVNDALATGQQQTRTVTINPAKILGIDKWVGSIDVGKDADLAIWDGFPLELTSKTDKVFIDGNEVYTRQDGFLPWKGRPAGIGFSRD